jgi:multiple sugar transport system ATP-binding protein
VLKGAGLGPAAVRRQRPQGGCKASSGKAVLGARHSTMKLHHSAVAGSVPGKVLYGRADRRHYLRAGVLIDGEIVNISLPPTVVIEPDEQVWVEFDQERMHLFDGVTTMALTAA